MRGPFSYYIYGYVYIYIYIIIFFLSSEEKRKWRNMYKIGTWGREREREREEKRACVWKNWAEEMIQAARRIERKGYMQE